MAIASQRRTESDIDPRLDAVLTRLVDAGRKVIYFGVPAGRATVRFTDAPHTIEYPDSTFASQYLDLESAELRGLPSYGGMDCRDTLAGFAAARPTTVSFPEIRYNQASQPFKTQFTRFFRTDEALPFTGAFAPSGGATILYSFVSAYPESSELHGLPCGLKVDRPTASLYLFSFHLWGMEQTGARELIDLLLDEPAPELTTSLLPERLRINQNHPNPFNQSTTISFFLEERAPVTLDIFNVLGQHVRRLLDERSMPAGVYHRVEWDGRAEAGGDVASGVYFYRLSTPKYSATKKMTLLK